MLVDEVVDAVRQRDFHVWAVRTIDEGIELLTGRECAEVHQLVRDRLNGVRSDYAPLSRWTALANTTDSDP
jgi:predicted ATP-dependent protease